MKYKTVKTKKDIENDPRVRELHKEFGFAGEDKYGWWCYLNDGWLSSNNSQTINEATLKDLCYEINNLESVFLLYDVSKRFETGVLEHLRRKKSGDLYILSDFYFLCIELLDLDFKTGEYWKNKRKIQYRLKKMKAKGLIDWRRVGTGFIGKTDFGMTSLNSYTLPDFWL